MTGPRTGVAGGPPGGRRRWLALLLLAVVLVAAMTAVHVWFALGVVPLAYAAGRIGVTWPAGVVVALLAACFPAWSGASSTDPRVWSAIAAIGAVLGLLPWLVGRHVRDRRALARAESELADHLAQRDLALVTRARERERTRIAQEMHDTLGHQLSLIALRAGALEVGAGTDSDVGSREAGRLRADVTRATEQLREVVGLLADASAGASLLPLATDVEHLVHDAADAGMDVTLVRRGPQPPTATPLVEQAVLRVVQEGLTNAAKHAPGAEVGVTVERSADAVVVTVESRGGDGATDSAGGGRGLAALRDRVDYLGGTCTAAPVDGGFTLRARMPARPVPDPARGPVEADAGDRPHDRVAAGRRRTHRSALGIVLVPLGVLVLVVVGLVGWYSYVTVASVLTPAELEQVSVGDPQEDAERVLPTVEMLEPPTDVLPSPAPGTVCRYYEGEVSFFDRRQVHRICFADGTVVATDTIPPGSP